MTERNELTGYPTIDKPWLKYYTQEAINAELPECTIYEYVYEANKEHLDDTALLYFGNKISYKEFFKQIERTRNMLLSIGVKRDDIVSVISITSPEVLYLVYALSRIGASANMLDPRMPIDILEKLITDKESRYLFVTNLFNATTDILFDKCNLKAAITINMDYSMSAAFKVGYKVKMGKTPKSQKSITWNDAVCNEFNSSEIKDTGSSDSSALIVYTGGTTGSPKGVVLSNYNINAVAEQYKNSGVNFVRGQLWQHIAAPFIAYVLVVSSHIPLSLGITGKITIYDPEKIADDIIKTEYNHISGNPAVWEKVIHSPKAKNKDFSHLIMPISGADAINATLWQEINAFLEAHKCGNYLCNGYGMTELASAVCVNLSKNICKLGSVGIPFTHTTIAAFDIETNDELKYDERGEICVLGPSIMQGYFNNTDATNEMIRVHKDGKHWLHTGDLGHVDSDGFVFIDGRIKRMIIRENGAKVFPGEIETVILKNTEIQKCVVVGKKESDSTGSYPVAFIVLNNKCDINTIKERISSLCEKSLQDYALPKHIQVLDTLPLTPIGKIDYRALEKLAEELFKDL